MYDTIPEVLVAILYLSTFISEFPAYVSRKSIVSDVGTAGGDQEGDYKPDGTINTGYIPNWIYLSNTDKNKVIDEEKNQGVKLSYGKGSKTVNELDNIKELNKQNLNIKGNIKALKKKAKQENDNDNGDLTEYKYSIWNKSSVWID